MEVNCLEIKKELRKKADKKRAVILQGFFKTGKGEYGEGDVFLGVLVPEVRKIAKKHRDIKNIENFLQSKIHEERLVALLIMIEKFNCEKEREKIFKIYLKNLKWINNWDLVDISADKIIGRYLFDKEKKIIYNLAASTNLWERRIAMISTFYFIKQNSFKEALKVAKILLGDDHDLIHKAVGWMLREIGKRDMKVEEEFLDKNLQNISRTTLRYAIERFSKKKRKYYLKKQF